MPVLSVIRWWHYRDGLPIREIAGRTGLSRNTVRKYLRLNGVEPKFQVPARQSKLDPLSDRLTTWLKSEDRKPRRQKRTVKQIQADLVSLLYEGSYSRVATFAREWKADLHVHNQPSLEERCRFFCAVTQHEKMRGSIAGLWMEDAQPLMPVPRSLPYSLPEAWNNPVIVPCRRPTITTRPDGAASGHLGCFDP